MYVCRLYTVFTWISKNPVVLLRHVEHGVASESCQKWYVCYIQIISEVIHGTQLCSYCGPP
jgi:hypothetical protein